MNLSIEIRCARTNNLKNVDVDIPLNRMTVVTGLSGSGKSSLVYHTLYAQSQRQYLEGLSPSLRAVFRRLPVPDVDAIRRLPPTVAIEQAPLQGNPRATVSTATEIYDLMRALYARLGTVLCPNCQTPLSQQSELSMVRQIMRRPEGTRLLILAPIHGAKGDTLLPVLEDYYKRGYVRVRLDGDLSELESLIDSVKDKPAGRTPVEELDLEIVVDRCVVRESARERIAESVSTAIGLSGGTVIILQPDAADDSERVQTFSSRYVCLKCGENLREVEPRTFSFHSPYGACERCNGLGVISQESEKEASTDSSPSDLANSMANSLANGMANGMANASVVCPDCGGSRLNKTARSVKILGKSIDQWAHLEVEPSLEFTREVREAFRKRGGIDSKIAQELTDQILLRLDFMKQTSIGYLALDRSLNTLSGGEMQRVKLSSALGSGLTGICYILDEPSVGLHPDDCRQLIETVQQIKQRGNTIVVVEHDEQFIRAADHIIDIGPRAGELGGSVVASGTLDEIKQNPKSLTGQYFRLLDDSLEGQTTGPRKAFPQKKPFHGPGSQLVLTHARRNNLQDVTLTLPLGVLTVVTGRSGSGKSSLFTQTVLPAVQWTLSRQQKGPNPVAAYYDDLTGVESLSRVVWVDQSPIGRSPRSAPATFTGIFDLLRTLYAQTRQAKLLGFTPARFAFNAASGRKQTDGRQNGRCEYCQGLGYETIETALLPDQFAPCPVCGGKRFNRQTLSVEYKGKTIADVLDMSIDQAESFFENIPKLQAILQTLREVGLGYLRLGQGGNTLSGGESQRLKLATELVKSTALWSAGKTLYLLDEPTTGLHPYDIEALLKVLRRLTDQKNTVVVIEHNNQVVAAADYLITLGPGGGRNGGRIIEEVSKM